MTRAASTNLKDPTVSRAVDEVRKAAQTALDRRQVTIVGPVDLAIGTNAIQHGLGRAPAFVSVMSTALGGSWALHADNPHPDRQVLIDVSGVAQPGASILVS